MKKSCPNAAALDGQTSEGLLNAAGRVGLLKPGHPYPGIASIPLPKGPFAIAGNRLFYRFKKSGRGRTFGHKGLKKFYGHHSIAGAPIRLWTEADDNGMQP